MKKLTDKQRKILDITVSCMQVAIVIVAIIISAIVIANPIVGSAKVGKANTKLLPVLTDSMDGNEKDSFAAGDLVIAKEPKDKFALKIGDIITYKGSVGGYEALITHRIVKVVYDATGKPSSYYAVGDKYADVNNPEPVHPNNVLAVYKTHINKLGAPINWLQNDKHFLVTIVLPLVVLFIYNIVMFVRMLMINKMENMREQAENADSTAIVVDEEEIKRKAIEEYLAKQSQENLAEKEEKNTTDVEKK